MPDLVSTRPLLDKLGIKPAARVHLIGAFAAEFRSLLRTRTVDMHNGLPTADRPADLVFLTADSFADLQALMPLRHAIRPNGAIWVVFRKGKQATLRDTDVIAAALDAGLVDNKVVSFSETQTALRSVIRLRDR